MTHIKSILCHLHNNNNNDIYWTLPLQVAFLGQSSYRSNLVKNYDSFSSFPRTVCSSLKSHSRSSLKLLWSDEASFAIEPKDDFLCCILRLVAKRVLNVRFTATLCVYIEITLVGSNQYTYIENANECSKRTIKTRLAIRPYFRRKQVFVWTMTIPEKEVKNVNGYSNNWEKNTYLFLIERRCFKIVQIQIFLWKKLFKDKKKLTITACSHGYSWFWQTPWKTTDSKKKAPHNYVQALNVGFGVRGL